MVIKQQLKLVSGSSGENIVHMAMQDEIDELRKQLGELSLGLDYLATVNVQLSRDMQLIHESLKDISTMVDSDDLYNLFGKWGNYGDDDLPN